MPTLYIETTIVSYLAARPANNITDAARQLSTHEWWAHRRSSYQLFTSVVVVREAEQGDTEAAMRTAIEQTITQQHYRAPIIATPDELLSERPFSGE